MAFLIVKLTKIEEWGFTPMDTLRDQPKTAKIRQNMRGSNPQESTKIHKKIASSNRT